MTPKEALAICEMILAHYWTREIPDERKAVWVGRLTAWPYEIAKDAVYLSTDECPRFPPSWAEFRDFMRVAKVRRDQSEGLDRLALPSAGDTGPPTEDEAKAILAKIRTHRRKMEDAGEIGPPPPKIETKTLEEIAETQRLEADLKQRYAELPDEHPLRRPHFDDRPLADEAVDARGETEESDRDPGSGGPESSTR